MNVKENQFEEKLQEYAKLVVCSGINVQKEQEVVISSPVDCAFFTRLLVKEAYKAGAKEVVVHWNDDMIARYKYEYSPLEVFETMPEWRAESYNYYAKRGAAFISISSSNPEILKGIDSEKLVANAKAGEKAMIPLREATMSSQVQWNVVAIPEKTWAKKVFPNVSENEAMDKLWEAIFTALRINDGNPVEKWETHDINLSDKCKKLNDYQFSKLHYKNQLGTDFVVGLVENHKWEGGSEVAGNGTRFLANMPTEEVFTMPHKDIADGVVVSSMPLSYQGNLIENFSLTFKGGKVVDFSAEKGYDTLKDMLSMDEGALHLGEVALVPYDSPISNMDILFYNTLFDENASCHFALGRCYPTNVVNGTTFSEEEMEAVGGNSSMIHVDFMVGSSDLQITGITKDGEEVIVFKDGNWAI